jgi:hypothetical protein
MQLGSERQVLQFEPARRDILPKVPGPNRVAGCAQLIEEFRPHQVDLSVIRPGRPHSGDIPMSNVATGMRVAFNAVISDEDNLFPSLFAERVLRVSGHSNDDSAFSIHALR